MKKFLLTLAAALGLTAAAVLPVLQNSVKSVSTDRLEINALKVENVEGRAAARKAAPAKAPAVIADYTGTYDWTRTTLLNSEPATELTVTVTDEATGAAKISGFVNSWSLDATIDLAAGTLTIPTQQKLGTYSDGSDILFYLAGVTDAGQISGVSEATASVGTINGGTITFPNLDVWALGIPGTGYFTLTYRNALTLQEEGGEPVDPNEGWTEVGEGQWYDPYYALFLQDGGDPLAHNVTVWEKDDQPGYYRFYPYAQEDNAFNVTFGLGTDDSCVIYLDTTDPEKTYIDGDWIPFADEIGYWYSHVVPENYWNGNGLYATYNEETGVVSFPAKSVYMSEDPNFAEGVYYAFEGDDEFKIVLPSKEAPADEPTGVTYVFQPAAGELINGADYYIFDNNSVAPVGANDRYGFFADQNGTVKGVKQMPETAYNNKSITGANYVWTAKQKEGDPTQWYFVNKSTGKYISNGNSTSATEIGYCTLEQYPNMNNTYFRVTNASTSKQFDANCTTEISLSWWAGTGHPIQFYAAVEEGDGWQLAANEEYSYTITCNYICGEETIATYTFTGAAGQEYTFTAPQFYKGETITGTITKYNTVYNVPCELSLPFQVSADIENAKYQALMIHSSFNNANPYTLAYNDDDEEVGTITTPKTSSEPYAEEYMFALIGSYEEGFKLYNKTSQKYVVAATSTATAVTLGDATEATVWQVKASRTNAGEQFFCLLNGATSNQYMNLNQPVNRLSYWTDNDNGSTMWAAGVSQPVVNYYNDFFTNAANTFEGNADMLEIVAEGQALVDALDPWNALSDEEIAAIDAVKAQLELAVYRAEKKNDLKKYFEASYTGAADYEFNAGMLDWAETQEEIDAFYAEALSTAMAMFQSDFETGAVLKNKRSGKYFQYAEIVNPDDDEDIYTAYQVTTTAGLNTLFTAQFTDDGNSVLPAERTFRLYNVASKTYVGIQAANNSVVPVVTDAEEAALLQVVAGNNGFEMIITNAKNDADEVVANNYINASTAGDAKLVTWQYANDGGAFWIAEQLPTFTQPVEVAFIGETTMGAYGVEEYASIDAITVKVPVGAKATELGTLRAYVYDEDYNEVTIYESSVADALEGKEAAESNIKVTTYDFDEEYNVVENTETYPADLYTIVLNPARTAVGEYHVTLSAAAFTLTEGEEGEEVTTYSPEAVGFASISAPVEGFEIEVTPAAGEIAGIVNITLNSYTGMQPNWAYSGDNVTLTYLPGTEGAETIVSLDGDGIAAYDTFDWDDASVPFYTIPVNVTKEGQYTLIIPEGFFENDTMAPNKETIVTWTVDPNASISEISVSTADGKTYDLQGRRVVAPVKGNLYIINGVKTLVK